MKRLVTVFAGSLVIASYVASAQDVQYINALNLEGTADCFYKSDDLLLIGKYGGLEIVDISEPRRPVETGVFLTSDVKDIDVSGNYAYLATGPDGLVIVDISNPGYPELTGSIPSDYALWSVKVQGDYAYLTDDSSRLKIVNIEDPAEPFLVSDFSLNSMSRPDLAVSGSYAYVVPGRIYGGSDDYMEIVDVSDRANPSIMASIPLGSTASVCVLDQYAVVGSADSGIVVIDVSDAGHPEITGRYRGYHDRGYDVATDGNYIYAAGWDAMSVFDISDPGNPDRIGGYFVREYCTKIFAADGYSIINAGTFYDPLTKIIDVTDPAWCLCLANWSSWQGDVIGNVDGFTYAFMDGGISAIDLSDPYEPQYAGHCTTPIIGDYRSLEDGFLYTTWHGYATVIYDLRDPYDPHIAGFSEASGYYIDVSNSYAYVTDTYDGLWVVDCTDPSDPVTVAHLDSSYHYRDIASIDDYAYISHGSGVRILDISDPSDPFEVGMFDVGFSVQNLSIFDNRLYVRVRYHGLLMCNIDNRLEPFIEGTLENSDIIYGLYVSGNYAYLTFPDENKLLIADVSDPADPFIVVDYEPPAPPGKVFVDGDYIYISSASLMIFRFDRQTGTVEEVDRIPRAFSLSQNHPNPFNASTTIRYNLTSDSHTTIGIFDILGRKVETLIQGEQPAGYNQVIWNAGDVSSGIYFYRIQAGEYAETRKMVLLK